MGAVIIRAMKTLETISMKSSKVDESIKELESEFEEGLECAICF